MPDLGKYTDMPMQALQEAARADAAKRFPLHMLQLGTLAFTGGSALAGLSRLTRLRKEQQIDNDESNSQNSIIRVMKHSGFGEHWDAFKKGLMPGNSAATQPYHFPTYAPAAGLTIAAGLGGGYLATDAILAKLRDAAAKKEIDKARQEYENAIFGASGGKGVKLADADGELTAQLSRVVDAFVVFAERGKLAFGPEDTQRYTGSLAGLYLLLAGGGLTAGAYHGYKAQRRKSDSAAVSRANKERQLSDNRPVTLLPTVIPQPGSM